MADNTATTPAPPPPARRRLLPRLLAWLLLTPLLLIALFFVAAWFWAGSDTSLATALGRSGAYLPAGHSLVAEGVRGSLRQGGHIDHLRYDANGFIVDARQVELAWRPAALLDQRLQLDQVQVQQLSLVDRRPPGGPPLQELVLPLALDIHFNVAQLQWQGPPLLQASQLAGRYQYTGQQHQLQLDSATYAAGQYQGHATLAARAPMALDAQLQARLTAQVPGSAAPWPLTAQASAKGPLAGKDAELAVLAQLQAAQAPTSAASKPVAAPPTTASAKAAAPPAIQANMSARIQPLAAQPVVQASAQFQQFDLALVWPQAPQTRLSGNVLVQPQAQQAWAAQADVRNALAGPWDQNRLPVDSAQARAVYSQGGWTIESLTGSMAGGQVRLAGQVHGLLWTGQASLRNIDPHALHTRLAQARLDGNLKAHSSANSASTVDFEAQLQPSAQQPAASALQGLRLKGASANGRYGAGLLTLQTLNVQTTDATLQGQLALQVRGPLALQGALQLTLPGANATARGKLAAQDGNGELSLTVANAALAQRWLAGLPGVPATLTRTAIQGQGTLTGQWQGGWQQSSTPARVQATLNWPTLDWGGDAKDATHLRALKAELAGTLAALQLTASAQAQTPSGRFNLQTQLTGAREAQGGNNWQGRLQAFALQAQDKLQASGAWNAQLRTPLDWRYTSSAGGAGFSATAGELLLTGPLPGSATLAWAPVQWRRDGAQTQLQSKGQLKGLPLPWLELLGNTPLVNLGLRGDVLLDGDWDLNLTDKLQLQATLVRRSGDLRLQTDDSAAARAGADSTISAGISDARISLSVQNDAVQLKANWASERAGQAQAEFSTRVTSADGQWDWPADAPLSGSLKAQLPKVGVWSVLAPPGWRIRGTLDAALAVQGTRQTPQWRGTLNADDLALRSVVSGLDLSNGKLRSHLNGQRLELEEFSLQGASSGSGAKATKGGQLNLTGFAQWLTRGQGGAGGLSLANVRIELDATAQALRLSSRADQRLALSGKLHGALADSKLLVRGTLKADEALFILPSESTPSLGDDVVVRGSGTPGKSAPEPAPKATPTTLRSDLQITLDLGPDFQVQGRGLSTRLAGSLTLADNTVPGTPSNPRLTGEVRTERGTYKAYGQRLDIEEGVLRFTGPYDNPALDILAIRPNITQRVGVPITGTVLSPKVRLYAEPELAEAEKLAWLVLGRSAAAGGTEAVVLQQAALALLGGNGKGLTGGLAEALGLDELSFRGSSTLADGTTSAAAVTLGKRFSRNFYIAYERSLAGTLGTFYVFYDLSKRFTLRAQTGEQSGVDLIFTVPYD
jgi:translocation and assembly module TamB